MSNSTEELHEESSERRNDLPLIVENRFPTTVYLEILRQTGSTDYMTRLSGDQIGIVRSDDPDHPIQSVETRVRGSLIHTQWEDISDQPGKKRGVGDKIPEFNLETIFQLHKHTYVDDHTAVILIDRLSQAQYSTKTEEFENGTRKLVITSPAGPFELFIGFRSAEDNLTFAHQTRDNYQKLYSTLVSTAQKNINKIVDHEEENGVSLKVKNSHPNLGPSGQPLESKKQVLDYLTEEKKLVEIVGTVLTAELGGGKQFGALKMEWKTLKTAVAIWHEQERINNPEDLSNLSLTEINNSLVRVIQALAEEKNCPDLVNENGMDDEAKKLLKIIEVYFEKPFLVEPLSMELMAEKDRALLALGLTLKCCEPVLPTKDGSFISESEATIAGITFHRYGESRRDKFEFYLQQDRKFGYQRKTGEAADFFLLHTTKEGQADSLTRYERIQSENLEKARKWLITELEPAKKGNYTTSDVQKINSLLLSGLIPERDLGRYRQTENTVIIGRIGATRPGDIENDLAKLLKDTGEFILSTRLEGKMMDKNTVIERLAQEWAAFDAIHPEEEGNGRTGTMLFESWFRLLLGNDERFESTRKENFELASAMSKALEGDSDREFYYRSPPELSGDIKPLIDYIKSHLIKIS